MVVILLAAILAVLVLPHVQRRPLLWAHFKLTLALLFLAPIMPLIALIKLREWVQS